MAVSEGTWDLSSGSWDDLFGYRHVYIRNGLDNGTILTFHCKSKDDDLGIHTLNNDEEFKFQFRRNLFSNTVFCCNFTWNGISHRFDIYNYKRDEIYCHDCYWSIKPQRPCGIRQKTRTYDICRYDYY
ncbi:unnamed protein product [Lupinus luteus]|uniref:S-protein homolog n=1 Tax=Lupinus luteus TaxID=3873 RepID=A0AAV1WQJ3_LUPLU